MARHTHLTLQERSIISVRVTQGASFSQIAAELEKDPGTISREIKKHRVEIQIGSYGRPYNPCIHKKTCTKTYLCKTCLNRGKKCSFCKHCTKYCSDFEELVCPKLSKPPYVCNGCNGTELIRSVIVFLAENPCF